MKKLFTLLVIVLFSVSVSVSVFAQVPQKMSYQSVIRNSLSQLVTSHAVGMRISILQGSASGTAVYTETQTPTTNANGLASLEIGGGTPVTGTFASIDWSAGTYFIRTETDPAGGTSYTIISTSQLLSVPYALHAKTAEFVPAGVGSFTHYIGELYGGGIVVSVWKESGVEHGLIASLTNVSSGAAWSNVTSTLIGVTAQSAFDGQANTNAIIGQSGHITSAAKLCDDYTADGFNDWYLPAPWELNLCYNAAFIVNNILGATNGFLQGRYWTSLEDGNGPNAGFLSFHAGYTDVYDKNEPLRVRAVRRF